MRPASPAILLAPLALLASAALAAAIDDGDMEAPGLGPWRIYNKPALVEKSGFARNGLRSLHAITDTRSEQGRDHEGVSRFLGEFQPGDLITVSFWYWVKDGRDLIAALGPTFFQSSQVMTGTDWTRAELSLRVTQPGRHNLWISQSDEPAEFFLDDLSLEVTRRPRLGTAPEQGRVTLVGGPLRLTLCAETGALCGIENLATPQAYAPVGLRQPLFGLELLAPDQLGSERVPFERAKLVRLGRIDPANVTLDFEIGTPRIRVAIAIAMGTDGSAQFTGQIQNDSDRRILAFEMPILHDVSPATDPARLTLVDPHVCGRITRDAARSQGCKTTYPGRGVMGWMDLSGERGGISLATHDRHQTGTRLSALPTAESRFDLSLAREIAVRPGGTWSAPPSVVAVHDGDWHAAADRYRAWARTWMPLPDVPRWMHDDNGWVLMGVQNNIPFHRIPNIFRQAQWMGIEFLHVQGQGIDNMWFDPAGKRQGHTMTYPYPSPRFGGPDDLRAAIREIHANDGHVMFYFLFERWTPSHESADDFGTGRRDAVPEPMRPPKGLYATNALLDTPAQRPLDAPPFMGIRNMCLGSPGWREWMRRWAIDVYAREYGADGFYWDVMGRTGPFRCFNANHGHRGQNLWARGCAEILETAMRQGREINPDYSCAIEGCSDHLGRWVGYHLMSGATREPNVFRYTFPELLCVDGLANHYWTWTQTQKARRVFLDGMRFDLQGYHQQIKRIIELRRRVKPFIDWPAIFRDTIGVKVSDPRIQARAFLRSDGGNRLLAVTILNEERIADATVEVDLAPVGAARCAHVFHLDGRVAPIDLGGGTPAIFPAPEDPVSCAVLCAATAPALQAHAWLEPITTPGPDGVTLDIFTPIARPDGLAWRIDWPAGFEPEESLAPDAPPGLTRVRFLDRDPLTTPRRWAKLEADVSWNGGRTTAWTIVAPPLVNGDMEEVEHGRLVYWGLPPSQDAPARGRSCLRVDRSLTEHGHVTQLTPLKPGATYRFSCQIRRTCKSWAGAHVVEYETGREGESKFVRSAKLDSSKVDRWERLETTFGAHPDPRTSAIYLYNGDSEHPAFFDDITLEEIPSRDPEISHPDRRATPPPAWPASPCAH